MKIKIVLNMYFAAKMNGPLSVILSGDQMLTGIEESLGRAKTKMEDLGKT